MTATLTPSHAGMAPEKVRLSGAQQKMLLDVGNRRPVADNDERWLSLSDCRRPTLWALVRLRLIETRHKGPITTGAQMHRLTAAGRAYVARARAEQDRGDGEGP